MNLSEVLAMDVSGVLDLLGRLSAAEKREFTRHLTDAHPLAGEATRPSS